MKYRILLFIFIISGFALLIQKPITATAFGGGQAGRPIAYPDRPKAPQDVLDRGKATFGVSCAFCHGSDAGGGEGGPNLLRSTVVLDDQNGELITPIVHGARIPQGMPRIDITDSQVTDIAAWLHSLHIGSRSASPEAPINVLTGDAKAGEAAFQKMCSSCHSVTGDLKDFAGGYKDPRALQQAWLLPGGQGGRPGGPATAAAPPLHVQPTGVTVTLSDGRKIDGDLIRIDDFYVGLKEKDGTLKGFDRDGDSPKVEIHDYLAPHRELFKKYTDKEIHDITAYLVTLK